MLVTSLDTYNSRLLLPPVSYMPHSQKPLINAIADRIKRISIIVWDIFSVLVFPIIITRMLVTKITAPLTLPAGNDYNFLMKEKELDILKGKQKNKQTAQEIMLNNELQDIYGLHKNREEFLLDPKNQAEQITVQTEDGVAIDTLQIKNSQSDKWIVYFCPNATCYEEMLDVYKELSKKTGANIYVGNYRGVMRSKGSIHSTNDLVLDGKAMIEKLLSQGIPQTNILIHGWSLGGAVGTEVASHYPDAHLVNDRSFNTFTDAIKVFFPSGGGILGSIAFLTGWKFNSVKSLQKIKGKKLVIYSKHDRIILYQGSLHKALENKKISNTESLELKFGANQFIREWKEKYPNVSSDIAEKLATQIFIRQYGNFCHNHPLMKCDTKTVEKYLFFVKNALKIGS
jgi:hypothetical protein